MKTIIDPITDRFIKALHKKFEESYPDTFVKCNAQDKETYESANGAMYSWYIKILNSLDETRLSPKYPYTPHTFDHANFARFVDDFEKADNWQSFIFENIVVLR